MLEGDTPTRDQALSELRVTYQGEPRTATAIKDGLSTVVLTRKICLSADDESYSCRMMPRKLCQVYSKKCTFIIWPTEDKLRRCYDRSFVPKRPDCASFGKQACDLARKKEALCFWDKASKSCQAKDCKAPLADAKFGCYGD